MRRSVLAVAAILLAAGCVASTEEPPAPVTVTPAGVVIDEDRPDTAFGEIVTGPAVGPDLNATLDAPPRLIAGEWWRYKFTPTIGIDQPEVVRVVAEVLPDGYVIGMPHEGWYKEAISFHSPAFGDVGLDLSYATHNVVFQPLRFPIVAGDTWETTFATQELVATVESVEGVRATISLMPAAEPQPTDPIFELFFGPNTGMELVYDASVHEVVKFSSGIGMYEIVEHGYDFEGWVTIPRGEHTAIDYGHLGPITPGEPVLTRTIEVAGGYNRLTLMHLIIPTAPGAYRVRAVAPDGIEFLTERVGGGGMQLAFYEAKDPDGVWTSEDLVGGAGFTYSMGIAYHQYDIRLPDGAKRSDHSHEVVR